MVTSSAYFLVIHGSRNPKVKFAADQLQQLIAFNLQSKSIITQENYLDVQSLPLKSETIDTFSLPKTLLVEIAPLELAPLPLNESLVRFAHKACSQGINRIRVLPLFLAPGVHVTEDIPKEVSIATEKLNNRATIELSPFLGKYSGMVKLLNDKFLELSAQTRILIAHGSRLPGVTDYYLGLAQKLNAITAYWSQDPQLTEQIRTQIGRGKTQIAILPYFLFPGRIIEAIASEVAELQQEYPEAEIKLGEPLGKTEALAKLIAQEI